MFVKVDNLKEYLAELDIHMPYMCGEPVKFVMNGSYSLCFGFKPFSEEISEEYTCDLMYDDIDEDDEESLKDYARLVEFFMTNNIECIYES